jgi:hypothetical protein
MAEKMLFGRRRYKTRKRRPRTTRRRAQTSENNLRKLMRTPENDLPETRQ